MNLNHTQQKNKYGTVQELRRVFLDNFVLVVLFFGSEWKGLVFSQVWLRVWFGFKFILVEHGLDLLSFIYSGQDCFFVVWLRFIQSLMLLRN